MADEELPQDPQEETPEEGQTGFIAGIERTPEVDEELRSFGIDPDNPEGEEKKEEVPQEQTTPQPNAEQPPAPEEKPTETVDETPKEETVSEEQAQQQIEEQLGEKKQENEEYPWEKEGREPTQREVLDYVAQKSADIQEQRKLDAEKEAKQKETQQLAEYQNLWKGNIKFLEDNNYIPKSAEGHYKDPNDAGNKARTILHEQAVLHGELDLEKVYWRYAKPLIDGKQPPGERAPITTQVNANTEKESDDDFFYDEIHGKDPSREYDSVELDK